VETKEEEVSGGSKGNGEEGQKNKLFLLIQNLKSL